MTTTTISFTALQVLALTASAWNIAPQTSAFIFADAALVPCESVAA